MFKVEEYFNSEKEVAAVIQWMQNQPHFPETLDRRSVENFLIVSKLSIEKVKRKIDNYFTFKTKLSKIYDEINPSLPHMKEVREIMYFVAHPRLLDNNRVFFFKMRNKDLSDRMEPVNLLRHLVNIHEIRMREDVVHGEIFIIDCGDIPLGYYLKLTPTMIFQAMVLILGKLYSLRLKSMYFINVPPFGEKVLKLAEKILKPKIFKRIEILSNYSGLLQKFQEEFLPKEFGGKGLSLDELQEMLEKEFVDHQDLFDHLDKIRIDESLRPSELKNDEILGFYGNFKQLAID